MVDVTRTVIRLGNFSDGIADIDPDGINGAENAGALVGQTFTGATMSIETVTYSDGDGNGFIDFDDTVGPGGDYIIYDLGSGPVSETIDHGVWYNVDILLGDGSTLHTSALIFQTPSGETFLTEFSASLDNLDIQSITPTYVNNPYFSRESTSASINNTTVCFAQGTDILTPDGPRPVETFLPGHSVLTTDGLAQTVVAVHRVPADPTGTNPPVRFAPSALGPGTPSKPLIVTANHRVLCGSRLVARMFQSENVFIPAKRFVGLAGIECDAALAHTAFFHLELKVHSVLCANGALMESCLIGPVSRRAFANDLMAGCAAHATPDLRHPVPKGHQQRQFVRRLARNGHPVIDAQTFEQHAARLRGGRICQSVLEVSG